MKKHNLVTALITPMHENGEIDFDSLATLIRRQEAANNGLLILGSTGEGLALKPEEHRAVVEFTVDLKPKVDIMVGIGGFQLDQQLQFMAFCNDLAIDSYLLVVPLYAKPDPVGQVHWFKTLLDASSKPCMLYNVPSRTGTQLAPDVLNELGTHPNLWALKEASGDLERYRMYHELAPKMEMYSGEDAMIAEMCKISCHGLVSVVANSWPQKAHEYVKRTLSGELTENENALWANATAASFAVSNPVPTKCWLAHQGVIESNVSRPPLRSEALSSLDELTLVDAALNEQYEGIEA